MTSALAALANATATFTVAGTGVVTDPATGNVSPYTQTVTASLFLKASPLKTMGFPGMEVAQVVYDGYAIAPLDPRIVPGTRGLLTFGAEENVEFEVTGLNLPFGTTGLLGLTLNNALGNRIELTAFSQNA